ncbi:MAG: hypothetical protein KAU50_08785 [Candidatus Marinimicrobia bacterium]|nr:hypothetical protein [Candidatus Neomarinimicrobiota bacterium]
MSFLGLAHYSGGAIIVQAAESYLVDMNPLDIILDVEPLDLAADVEPLNVVADMEPLEIVGEINDIDGKIQAC